MQKSSNRLWLLMTLVMSVLSTTLLDGQSVKRAERFHGMLYDDTATVLPLPRPATVLAEFLASWLPRSKKSEFETTDAYTARVSAAIDDSLWYLFDLPMSAPGSCTHSIKYDADARQFNVDIDIEDGAIRVVCMKSYGGSYVGQNGFGVKKSIRRYAKNELAFSAMGVPAYDEYYSFSIRMAADSAQRVASWLRLAVLVAPQAQTGADWVKRTSLDANATISDPVEYAGWRYTLNSANLIVYVYDVRSRHIIATKTL